jgi:hypothetical protein
MTDNLQFPISQCQNFKYKTVVSIVNP